MSAPVPGFGFWDRGLGLTIIIGLNGVLKTIIQRYEILLWCGTGDNKYFEVKWGHCLFLEQLTIAIAYEDSCWVYILPE